jgi:hypothetical protein
MSRCSNFWDSAVAESSLRGRGCRSNDRDPRWCLATASYRAASHVRSPRRTVAQPGHVAPRGAGTCTPSSRPARPLSQVDAHEPAHRRRVVQRLFHLMVGECKPLLQEMNTQHPLPTHRAPAGSFGQYSSISAHNAAHNTTWSISARNTSRRVAFAVPLETGVLLHRQRHLLGRHRVLSILSRSSTAGKNQSFLRIERIGAACTPRLPSRSFDILRMPRTKKNFPAGLGAIGCAFHQFRGEV